MRRNPAVTCAILLAPLGIAACTLSLMRMPGDTPATEAAPTMAFASTVTVPAPTTTPTTPTREGAVTAAPSETPSTYPFCQDQEPLAQITRFRSAIVNSDGNLLASLVSSEHGLDARLFRDGRVVNYDREHAAALFESTFTVNWGAAPGSGLAAIGSFRELLLPDLLDVLTREYVLSCNEIRVGGATYDAAWPYTGIDFYSLHFPGTPPFDGLDWHTWLLGMHNVGDDPYLYAIMQFKWEP